VVARANVAAIRLIVTSSRSPNPDEIHLAGVNNRPAAGEPQHTAVRKPSRCLQTPDRGSHPCGRHDQRGRGGGGPSMADLAYALLLVGGFAVLLLMMRGLQRL
jgi:hypothetical protein